MIRPIDIRLPGITLGLQKKKKITIASNSDFTNKDVLVFLT